MTDGKPWAPPRRLDVYARQVRDLDSDLDAAHAEVSALRATLARLSAEVAAWREAATKHATTHTCVRKPGADPADGDAPAPEAP